MQSPFATPHLYWPSPQCSECSAIPWPSGLKNPSNLHLKASILSHLRARRGKGRRGGVVWSENSGSRLHKHHWWLWLFFKFICDLACPYSCPNSVHCLWQWGRCPRVHPLLGEEAMPHQWTQPLRSEAISVTCKRLNSPGLLDCDTIIETVSDMSSTLRIH